MAADGSTKARPSGPMITNQGAWAAFQIEGAISKLLRLIPLRAVHGRMIGLSVRRSQPREASVRWGVSGLGSVQKLLSYYATAYSISNVQRRLLTIQVRRGFHAEAMLARGASVVVFERCLRRFLSSLRSIE